MKHETETKTTVSVKEIMKALNLSGELVSCGFNFREKVSNQMERKLTIVTRKKQ